MKTKKFDIYNDRYGDIPKNIYDRFLYLIQTLNLKIQDINSIKKSIKRILNIKYKRISFVFYFIPQATPRPRYSKFTKSFYIKNAINYNQLFNEFITASTDINFKISTPCKFYTKIYFPIPASMNKETQILSELELIKNISKPDWDNLGKTYSDMVQKYLIIDDALIFDGRVTKLYSSKPRIEIYIDYMEEYDCKYNKHKIQSWSSYNN